MVDDADYFRPVIFGGHSIHGNGSQHVQALPDALVVIGLHQRCNLKPTEKDVLHFIKHMTLQL